MSYFSESCSTFDSVEIETKMNGEKNDISEDGDGVMRVNMTGMTETEPLDTAASPDSGAGDSDSSWQSDDNYHLKKITDYKTYAKVRKL